MPLTLLLSSMSSHSTHLKKLTQRCDCEVLIEIIYDENKLTFV